MSAHRRRGRRLIAFTAAGPLFAGCGSLPDHGIGSSTDEAVSSVGSIDEFAAKAA